MTQMTRYLDWADGWLDAYALMLRVSPAYEPSKAERIKFTRISETVRKIEERHDMKEKVA